MKHCNNEQGVALVTALIVMALLTALASSGIMNSVTDTRISKNYRNDKEVFYAADAGWQVGKDYLNTVSTGIASTPASPTGTVGGDNTYTYALNVNLPGQPMAGYGPGWEKITYSITSAATGTKSGANSTITVTVKKPFQTGY